MKFKINLIDAIFVCILIMQIAVDIWAICAASWYGKVYAIVALATLATILVTIWRKK